MIQPHYARQIHQPVHRFRLQKAVWRRTAQIAQFDPAERNAYEDSLKYYRDLKNVTDTAHGEGVEEGRKEGHQEGLQKGRERGLAESIHTQATHTVKRMLQKGMSIDTIHQLTEFPVSEIEQIADKARVDR